MVRVFLDAGPHPIDDQMSSVNSGRLLEELESLLVDLHKIEEASIMCSYAQSAANSALEIVVKIKKHLHIESLQDALVDDLSDVHGDIKQTWPDNMI